MRYLSLIEVLKLHRKIIEQSGGTLGIRDLGLLESAIAQPRMTFDGQELYTDLIMKSAVLGFSIIMNHPFIDGNKRVGHATTEIVLILNGLKLHSPIDEQERIVLAIASGKMEQAAFVEWLRHHTTGV